VVKAVCSNTVLLASTYREVDVDGEVNVGGAGFNVALCGIAGVDGLLCTEVGCTVVLDGCLPLFAGCVVV